MDQVVAYLRRHLSRAQFVALVNAGVPMTGPSGLRRWVAERDLEAFIKVYLYEEFYLDFPAIHREFIADTQDIRDRAVAGKPGVKLARAIPRGHSKTSLFARVLPLHGFLFGWSPLTVLLGNNATAAGRLLKNIREVCELNDAIQEDFPELGAGETWGEHRIEYNGAAIVCFGVGSGAIRGVSKPGARPSLVIGDDLDDDDSVRSAIVLEANKDWFDRSVMALGDQVRFTTSFVVIGTIIRKTSLMTHVLSSPDFSAVVQQGVKRFADNAELWDQWAAWFKDRALNGEAPKDPGSDEFYQRHKEAMLAGSDVLWPRPDGYYLLMVYRLARGESAFASEIMNTPGTAGGTLVQPVFAPLPDNHAQLLRFGALDSTIKGGSHNDLAAWTEVLYDPRTKRVYVVLSDAERRPYNDTIARVVERLGGPHRFTGLWVESNAAGSIIIDLLAEKIEAAGLYYDPIAVHNRLPKADRIQAMSEYIARGQLLFVDGCGDELLREFAEWPTGRYDDALDSLSIVVLQLKELGYLDIVT